MIVYVNRVAYAEHVALVKGDIAADGPILVRMHALNLLDDILGDTHDGKAGELHAAMQMIGARRPRRRRADPRVPPDQPVRPPAGAHGRPRGERGRSCATTASARRSCSISASRDMILLSNTTRTIIGLEGYGLAVVGQQPISRTIDSRP